MKAPILALFFSAALLGTAQAQVKQPRTVAGFKAVEVSGGIDLVLTPGTAVAVVVDATAETQPHVQTTVRNGHLVIDWENGFRKEDYSKGQREVHVYVTCPLLTGLRASGGTTTRTTAVFTTTSFALEVSSGATATLALAVAQQLTSSTSSGSTATVSGTAGQQRATVSSGASYHAFGLQSTKAEVQTSSGSTAEVQVDGELSAAASSGSSVRYKGTAKVLKSKASSGGSIRKA
jgi:hypothetical protein